MKVKKSKKASAEINIEELLEKEIIVNADIASEIKGYILNYAVEVISDRALPDIYDGCKPVQRRILYEGFYKHYLPTGNHIKCAKYVGDVIGDTHPHSQDSVYLALVALAQPWTSRYPLIDFHGNVGNYDGDPPAAMRYSESKLSKLGEVMLSGINNKAVDMHPNYSETMEEPYLLPAPFPLLVCNGTSGIAVGYTTNIPSHNLNEIADAIIATIKNKDISIDNLMSYVPGPDICTGGQLINNAEIKKLYTTGKGSLTFRAKYHLEEKNSGGTNIVITELPPNVNKPKLVEKLYQLCIEEKKIPRVISVKDLSTKSTKVVIELQKTAVVDMVVKSLFDMTDLTLNCSYILRAVKDNVPSIFTLKDILEHYIIHRQNCIRNEHRNLLQKAKSKLHMQEGLAKVTSNLRKAINIIEQSDDDAMAKANLMAAFDLDEDQAEAVLEFKLRRLTKLNKDDIQNTIAKLIEDIRGMERLLNDENLVNQKIIEQLVDLKSKFGDARRTEIVAVSKETSIDNNQPVLLILTNKNTIKVLSEDAYKEAIGNNVLKERQEIYTKKIDCKMSDTFLLLLDNGNYLKVDFNTLLTLNMKNDIINIYPLNESIMDKYIICLTKNGLIQKIKVSGFKTRQNKQAQIFKNLIDGDRLIKAKLIETNKENIITLATKNGILHRFFEASFKDNLSAGKNGLSALNLASGDEIVGFDVSKNDVKVILYTKHETTYGIKAMTTETLNVKGRVGKGYSAITFFKKHPGEVVDVICVKENYFDIDNKGKLHEVGLNSIPVSEKNAKPMDIKYAPIAVNISI